MSSADCGYTWESDSAHVGHRCREDFDHADLHRCACGAVRVAALIDATPRPDPTTYNYRGEQDHHAEYVAEAIRTANGDPQRSTVYALLAIADALHRLASR